MKAKKLIATESQEQKALIKWLDLHPILKNYYFKIPNEGQRSKILGFNLKKEGLRAGISDLFIFYPTKSFHGFFLEMKRNRIYTNFEKKNKTWIAQQEFLESAVSVGYAGEFCFGWEQAVRFIEEYLET